MLAVVLADLVDRHDPRVVEEGDGLGLVPEAAELGVVCQNAGPDHLEGDGPIERDLSGLVDDPHAAAAQFPADLVVAEVADGVAAGQAVRRQFTGLRDARGAGHVEAGGRARSRDRARAGVLRRAERDGILVRREEPVELEVAGQGFGQVGEAAGVLGRGRVLAPLAAEEDLAEDQLDDQVGMGADLGADLDVRLDRDAAAGTPSAGLVGLESIGQRGGVELAPTRQVGPQVGERVAGRRIRSLVLHRCASQFGPEGSPSERSPSPHTDKIDN